MRREENYRSRQFSQKRKVIMKSETRESVDLVLAGAAIQAGSGVIPLALVTALLAALLWLLFLFLSERERRIENVVRRRHWSSEALFPFCERPCFEFQSPGPSGAAGARRSASDAPD